MGEWIDGATRGLGGCKVMEATCRLKTQERVSIDIPDEGVRVEGNANTHLG